MSICACTDALKEANIKVRSLSNHLQEHAKRFEKIDETNLLMMRELGSVEQSMRKIEAEQRNCLMHILELQHIVKDFISKK